MTTLLLIDGSNLAHKCKHVFSLSDGGGNDVSILFGFTKTLYTYLEKHEPSSVIVAWDMGKPKHRLLATKGNYKADRNRDPLYYEDYIRQVRLLDNNILPAMGVLSIGGKGIEADDFIYQAAVLCQQHYDKIIIISSDKDLYQVLIKVPNAYLNDAKSRRYFDELGIKPEWYVHWRALQGDTSDNIPGVKGIGEVTATKLFTEYGSLSGIWNAATGSNPKGKLSERVASTIKEFGWDALINNVQAMALHIDKTGARLSLLRHSRNYSPSNTKSLKLYMMKHAFVSLMNADFYNCCKALSVPLIDEQNVFPVVCQYERTPL